MWQFTLTQKGSQRGKNLAKSVGLVAKLEVDLESKTEDNGPREKSANKVTINMYDKELMPVVDELYMNDQSMTLLQMNLHLRSTQRQRVLVLFQTSEIAIDYKFRLIRDHTVLTSKVKKTPSIYYWSYFTQRLNRIFSTS